VTIQLDDFSNAKYRNPFELYEYIRRYTQDSSIKFYVFLDEIQFVEEITNPWLKDSTSKIGFVDVVLDLMKQQNIDLYITGSNSKMLSKDIVTQFRDRGDEIHLSPLSYSEFCRAKAAETEESWNEFLRYGGLPRTLSIQKNTDKEEYLKDLLSNTYLIDVIERNRILNDKEIVDDLINIVASSIGSLTNPKKISDTFKSVKKTNINSTTVSLYLDYFEDAFILEKAHRYSVKGRKYIGSPLKYYFSDLGLRNAQLNFRQQEENHIMENIIFNELRIRGYNVDVGVVNHRYINNKGKDIKTNLEVDFLASLGDKKIYMQSAFNIDSSEKRKQEIAPLLKINDSFKKIVIVKDRIQPWVDEHGINYVGIREFLSGNYDDMPLV
jgi:predicted AAA+ superfamily ATPase